MKQILRLSTFLLVVFLMPLAQAEQKKVYGDYEVHYIGLTSNFLTPEVAKEYDIPRSRSLGYVSISILKTGQEEPVSVDASLSGALSNLIGQRRSLEFKRIREGSAIYFITTFRFDEEEMYKFSIDILPNSDKKPITLEFKQKFYKEG